MLKTVVVLQTVVVGSLSVLLALTSQPAAPVSPPADVQQTAEALKALEQARSKIADCTFALKMKEVDPNFDARIRIEGSDRTSSIRRILPPQCWKK